MSDAKVAREWPLALFTVALQLSCGLALAAAFAESGGSAPEVRLLGIAVFPVVALGMAASLLHLGRPLCAWKSLTNVARSRLSREVWFTGAFAVAALAYGCLWFREGGAARGAMGAVTALLGVVALASSASIYAVPARPFWRGTWLPLSFAATTLLLGGLAGVIVARPGLLLGFIVAGSAGALLLIVSAVLMMTRWFRLRRRDAGDPQIEVWPPGRQARWNWVAFALHLLLAGAAPLALALWLWMTWAAPGARVPTAASVIAFSGALGGVALGRLLLYSLPDSLARF